MFNVINLRNSLEEMDQKIFFNFTVCYNFRCMNGSKSRNIFIMLNLYPNMSNSLSWLTLSNAALRSSKTNDIKLFESILLKMLVLIFVNKASVLKFFLSRVVVFKWNKWVNLSLLIMDTKREISFFDCSSLSSVLTLSLLSASFLQEKMNHFPEKMVHVFPQIQGAEKRKY